MRKLLLSITFISILMSGCINITVPQSVNNAPTACIDEILPVKANPGDSISFLGHGNDSDGTIIGYEWQSNLDGILNTAPNFKASTLSLGTHIIYLRVMDNRNLWSAQATSTVIIIPKVVKPIIESFVAVPNSIVRGGSLELRWSVSGAKMVSIDNGIGQVTAISSIILFPQGNSIYTLTASNEGGSVTATTSITVQESSSVGNPVITFTANHLGGTSWQLNWNVLYATKIAIDPDIGLVNPVGSRVVTVSSGQTKLFRLTATNDWGWAYRQVLLASP